MTASLQSQDLHILYTQNTNGVLYNCNCPDEPLGGMEKRATFFRDWLQDHPNTLIFDSGDFLSFDGNPASDAKMIEAMEALHYTAVNIGDQEFVQGGAFFDELLREANLPLVASNLVSRSGAALKQIPQYRIIPVQGLNLLVLGVIDSASFEYFRQVDPHINLQVTDPTIAITTLHRELTKRSKIDLVILLSNLGLERDRSLAASLTFIDVIIGGHSQDEFARPLKIGSTVITQCGKNGHYVGHLKLQIKGGRPSDYSGELIPMNLSIEDDPDMLEIMNNE